MQNDDPYDVIFGLVELMIRLRIYTADHKSVNSRIAFLADSVALRPLVYSCTVRIWPMSQNIMFYNNTYQRMRETLELGSHK